MVSIILKQINLLSIKEYSVIVNNLIDCNISFTYLRKSCVTAKSR